MKTHQINFQLVSDGCPYTNSQLDAWRMTSPPYSIHPGDLVEIRILDIDNSGDYLKIDHFKVIRLEHRYLGNSSDPHGEQSLLVFVEHYKMKEIGSLTKNSQGEK